MNSISRRRLFICNVCRMKRKKKQIKKGLCSGNALEKAGGREFQDGVKEIRKTQGPLEVASGTENLVM